MGVRRRKGRDELDDPLFSLIVTFADIAVVVGGSLGLVFTIGYAAAGRGFGAWGPNAAIVVGLVALDASLRAWRVRRRRREWRRWHPGEEIQGQGTR
jgi:hypothetical protein